mgnify:CR=1 FL=1
MTVQGNTTILVAEDDLSAAKDITDNVSARGYRVVNAHSGEEAVELALSNIDIDLLLINIDLQENLEGAETAKRIFRFRELPIIFLSDHGEAEAAKKAEEVPNYGFVVKNTGKHVLLETIGMALHIFRNPPGSARHRSAREEHHREPPLSEEKRSEAEPSFHAFFESIREPVLRMSARRIIFDCNPALAELFGYAPEELIGHSTDILYADENKHPSTEQELSFADEPPSLLTTLRFQCKDGSYFPGELSIHPLRPSYDSAVEYIAIIRDVSRRVHMEQELRSSNRFLSTLLNNLPGMAYRCRNDRNYTMNFVSSGVRELTGYGPDELLYNRSVAYGALVVEEDREQVWQTVQEGLNAGVPFAVVYRIRTKQEAVRWVWERGTGIYTSSGTLEAIEGFITDISERKEAEEELQRMVEEKNLVLQEVHHRIKNDMNTIRSLLSLQAAYSSGEREKEALEEARRRLAIMSTIYETLYTGESIHSLSLKPFLLYLIDNVREAYATDSDIRIIPDIDDMRISAKLAMPLGIIVNELLTNAYSHGFTQGREGSIRITVGLKEELIEVVVTDEGEGPPEAVSRGESYGFGLQLVSSITAQHQGALRITKNQSSEGGTQVYASLERRS